MKIKFSERDKVTGWILIGFFVIMAILVMLKPVWACENVMPTTPVTEPTMVVETTEPVETIETIIPETIVVIETESATEPTEKDESVANTNKITMTRPAKTEKVEKMEETEPVPTETVSETEPELEPEEEEEPALKSLGRFKLTAYCACSRCCGKSDGITASGTKAKQGRTIAVDPKQIPYGTKVVINGHTYTAEDCGSGIGKSCIDVFFDSHKEALNFGIQYAEVYIYTN